MSFADWAEIEAAKYFFTGEAMGTQPTARYLALHTGDPSDAGGSNEVVAGWYARQPVTLTRTNNTVTNSVVVLWNAVTGAGVTITAITIKDAVSGGNTIGRLTFTARSLNVGDIIGIQAGALSFTIE